MAGKQVDVVGAAQLKVTFELLERQRVATAKAEQDTRVALADITHRTDTAIMLTSQATNEAQEAGIRAYRTATQAADDAVTRAQQAGIEAMRAALSLPQFVSSSLADPRPPTADELAANEVILGSRLSEVVPGATQMLIWNRETNAWNVRGVPSATGEEVARQQANLDALQHPSLEAMLASTSQAPRHQAAGRRGGVFELLPAGALGDFGGAEGWQGIVHIREDGKLLRRILRPGEPIEMAWWPMQFGIVTDPALTDQENAARLLKEQQAVNMFIAYMKKNGGNFLFPVNTSLHANFHVENALAPIAISAYGFTVLGPDRFTSAVWFHNFKELWIEGMRAGHPSIGDAPPRDHLDPRRTSGGNGFTFIAGNLLKTSHLDVYGAASMGMVTWRVDVFQHDSPSVRLSMGDGIHTTGGCKQGTINGAVVRDCGDDGIPVVSYKPSQQAGDEATGAAGMCRNITINGGSIKNAGARGICVAGGENIIFSGTVVESTWTHGAIIHEDRGFETHAPKNVVLDGCIISGAGTYNPGGTAHPASGVYVSQGAENVTIGGGTQVYGATHHGLLLEGNEVNVGHVDVHHNAGCGTWVTGDNVRIGSDAVIRNNAATGYKLEKRPKLLVRSIQTTTLDGTPITRAEEYQETDAQGNPVWLLPKAPVFAGTSRGNDVGVQGYTSVPMLLPGAVIADNRLGLEAWSAGVIEMVGGVVERNAEGVQARENGRISLTGVLLRHAGGYAVHATSGGRVTLTGGTVRDNGTTPGAVNVQIIAHHTGMVRAVGVNIKGMNLSGALGAHDEGVLKLLACDLEEAGANQAIINFGNNPKITVKGCLGAADATPAP